MRIYIATPASTTGISQRPQGDFAPQAFDNETEYLEVEAMSA